MDKKDCCCSERHKDRSEEEKKKYRAEAEKFKAENSGKAEEAAEMLFGRIKNGDC